MTTNRHRDLRDHPRAFTLLEVLVTCAVLGLFIAILLSIFGASMTLWRDTDSKIYSDREARVARLQIAQDVANAVVPTDMALWPRVVSEGQNTYLQLLMKADPLCQPSTGDFGDICFVEYAIRDEEGTTLSRRFLGSAQTYTDIIQQRTFPPPGSGPDEESQTLAINLLPQNSYGTRGLEALSRELSNRKFILLAGPDLLPDVVNQSNPPRAIEVNLAIADPDTASEEGIARLENNPSLLAKDAGMYSFRIFLPPPGEL
jgi:prepilin-type N-terminal cleavage/methylation domain-containing protein